MPLNLTLCVPRASSTEDPFNPVLVQTSTKLTIPENHVLIRVEKFGFSANNITYQALGEAPHFRYFEFHAAPSVKDVSAETHGVIPVWGFGNVIVSTLPRIQRGERVYGYFAPTRYLLLPVSPSNVNKFSFTVPRPHLPADRRPYNQIIRCSSDLQYDPSPVAEDLTMLYRPLFWTAYWCEDWLNVSAYRGASCILISSASAKTAFCLAYLIGKRATKPDTSRLRVIGLTSKKNLDFTRSLCLYDDIFDYDSLERSLAPQVVEHKWLYIDVAGNDQLNDHVRTVLAEGSSLVGSVQLGLTTLSPSAPSASSISFTTKIASDTPCQVIDGRESTMDQFFMPEWLAVRRRQMSVSQITSGNLRIF